MVLAHNPNNSWASSSRTQTQVPRSTSVEYEEQTRQANRRLPGPNRSHTRGASSSTLKPPSRNRSLQHVPDSEGEDVNANGRATSPYQNLIDAAKRALVPAFSSRSLDEPGRTELYMVPKAKAPGDTSTEQPAVNGNVSDSYNYDEEEQFMQDAMQANRAEKRMAGQRRSKIPKDNQAYKPEVDHESSSEEDDDGRRRKTKSKVSHRVTNLPSVADGKSTTRKRRTKSRSHIGGPDDEISEDISHTDIHSQSAANRVSIPRLSVDPPNSSYDQSLNDTSGLDSITELPEEELPPARNTASEAKAKTYEKPKSGRPRSNSRGGTPARSRPGFSIGAILGKCVNFFLNILRHILLAFSALMLYFGTVLGTVFNTILQRPVRWAIHANSRGVFGTLAKYAFFALSLVSAWYILRHPALKNLVPSISLSSGGKPQYVAPAVPPQDISEVAARLARIEQVLSGLSLETKRIEDTANEGVKGYSDLTSKLGQIEGKLNVEAKRISEQEARARENIGKVIGNVKHEVEGLQAQLEAQNRVLEKESKAAREKTKEIEKELRVRDKEWELERERARNRELELEKEREREKEKGQGRHKENVVVSDEEARTRLRSLEERLAGVETGTREALELSSKLDKLASAKAKEPASTPAAPATGWWKSATKGLKLIGPDGQDVTKVLSQIVESSISTAFNDRVGKADLALHSAGGRVIPSLTSPTLQFGPTTLRGQFIGLLGGVGTSMGRPPVTALHHDTASGHCWPFAGQQGQLGVALAFPAFIEEFTIDHIHKDLAFDMRSAPRDMEVWGLIEGRENIEKLRNWRMEKIAAQRVQAEANGETVDDKWERKAWDQLVAATAAEYPRSLPRNPEYVKLANFTYDARADDNIQSFPVDPEFKALGVDVGLLALRVNSNWGRKEFTCLYRFRVHGHKNGEWPAPWSEEKEKEQQEAS
ncbi:hypothetical protein FA15DRAFT_701909 [Coprinopsis marcescibilis]|uniref:SUN domain-containing protein n=1 Tax=Coprinopsis marcescibilis TaxID=230819 RepID=A0A5C3L4L8_COPMA|nr:hypothetical protein FA15DRAFT_701909 [Coprinopsis marcescibilis]